MIPVPDLMTLFARTEPEMVAGTATRGRPCRSCFNLQPFRGRPRKVVEVKPPQPPATE